MLTAESKTRRSLYERFREFKPHGVGMHLPCGIHPKVQEENTVCRTEKGAWAGFQKACRTKGEPDYRGSYLCRPCPMLRMLLYIPPKMAVCNVVGFIKGKSAIHIARNRSGRARNFVGQSFWARGYFVSTVGRDEETITQYILKQEKEDHRLYQALLFK